MPLACQFWAQNISFESFIYVLFDGLSSCLVFSWSLEVEVSRFSCFILSSEQRVSYNADSIHVQNRTEKSHGPSRNIKTEFSTAVLFSPWSTVPSFTTQFGHNDSYFPAHRLCILHVLPVTHGELMRCMYVMQNLVPLGMYIYMYIVAMCYISFCQWGM